MRMILAGLTTMLCCVSCSNSSAPTAEQAAYPPQPKVAFTISAPKLTTFFPQLSSSDQLSLQLTLPQLARLVSLSESGDGHAIEAIEAALILARDYQDTQLDTAPLGSMLCELAEQQFFAAAAAPCIRWLLSGVDPTQIERAAKLSNWIAGTSYGDLLSPAPCRRVRTNLTCAEGGKWLFVHPSVTPIVEANELATQALGWNGDRCMDASCYATLVAVMDEVAQKRHSGALKAVIRSTIRSVATLRYIGDQANVQPSDIAKLAAAWRAWAQVVGEGDPSFARHVENQARCVEESRACSALHNSHADSRLTSNETLWRYGDNGCRTEIQEFRLARQGARPTYSLVMIECALQGDGTPQE